MENQDKTGKEPNPNQSRQGIDKDPAKERQQGEQVRTEDLKGKKVDRDVTTREDEPLDRDT
ncbi:MAG TPA: hypothetical protein VGC95_09285 [Chitinophagaceae bacterium]